MMPAPETHSAQPRRWTRFLPVVVLAAGFVAFFALGFDRYLSFAALSAHRDTLLAFTRDHLVRALALYALAYILVVAFSLPGGTIMTIAGGFLFGIASRQRRYGFRRHDWRRCGILGGANGVCPFLAPAGGPLAETARTRV